MEKTNLQKFLILMFLGIIVLAMPGSVYFEFRKSIKELRLLRDVNLRVNKEIAYVPDERLYGREEYWATPSETESRHAGDCEDYVLLKMKRLIDAGADPSKMYAAYVRVMQNGIPTAHMILLYQIEETLFVLDNSNNKVSSVSERIDIDYVFALDLDNNVYEFGSKGLNPLYTTSLKRRTGDKTIREFLEE